MTSIYQPHNHTMPGFPWEEEDWDDLSREEEIERVSCIYLPLPMHAYIIIALKEAVADVPTSSP